MVREDERLAVVRLRGAPSSVKLVRLPTAVGIEAGVRDRLHAGQRPQALRELFAGSGRALPAWDSRAAATARSRSARRPDRSRAARGHRPQAAGEQSGAGEQAEAERDLARHEHAAQADAIGGSRWRRAISSRSAPCGSERSTESAGARPKARPVHSESTAVTSTAPPSSVRSA